MNRNSSASNNPAQQTMDWLQGIVIGLNLCPFAAAVVNEQSLHIEVCAAQTHEEQLVAVLKQLDLLQQQDEDSIATSLLVFSQGLQDFDQYWGLVELAEEVLTEVGLDGVIQIASFHPDYCFEGVDADDVSHYTNRSPYPMLHFIREAQLSRALAGYPDPEKIPENNINRLRQLGKPALLQLLMQTAKRS
ncbi:DUF1415 domain-containing protein [Oceanicoccus sp. KOV_DT_Chl]|uniref:DUF1415 domain-containing protein n=1 Tax=Oceanicoccus sp. KOV_DT_Chl TaxID=1904639 RepID=UPI000C7C0E09|nr:DUF1415 domain-containing protein [Oceanicoccus sp. KOV_DT_Chl]